ncbi:hypothetical protein [Pontibacter qinzhouensis]|uniref:hypothetical protein n=1 Tax=Pontibacter qinzhouensis TaxID=2603253 RepID=UPI001C9BDFDA|nr:hypothetical protein [Pontibacter qinzhouensis]
MLTLFCQLAHGQETKVFQDHVFLNGEVYQANFNYYVNKKDTLYHGPFALSKEVEEAIGNANYKYAALNGHFNRNVADGNWAIRQGTFSSAGKGVYNDNAYIFKINGNEFIATGNLEKGRKNSPWQIYEWQIANSNIVDTLFSAQLPFQNDNLQGDLRLYYKGEYLEGSLDSKQFTDKRWSFYITDANGKKVLLKEWVFRDNQLVSKVLYENGQAFELNIQQANNQQAKIIEIPFDENYLKIIDLKASMNNPELYDKYRGVDKVRDLLFTIINKLQVVDSLFVPVSKVSLSPVLKTRVEVFPYAEAELPLYKAAQKNTQEAANIMLAVNKDPQVLVASTAIEKAAFYYSTLHAVENQLLAKNRTIIENYENGNLQYLNRNQLLKSTIAVPATIQVPFVYNNDTTHTSYNLVHVKIDPNQEPAQQFKALSETLLREIKHLKDSLDTYVQEIRRDEWLVESEAALLKKQADIRKLSDSLLHEQHDKLAKFQVKTVLLGFTQQLMTEFNGLGLQEKNQQVEATLNCLQQVENLILNLENVPENSYMVRDAYINKVFNPYTFTDMEEVVKEPIYNSFTDVLLPGVFSNLQKLSCQNITAYNQNFDRLFEGVLQALNRNTRREERQIKRTDKPAKAAEILHINLTF